MSNNITKTIIAIIFIIFFCLIVRYCFLTRTAVKEKNTIAFSKKTAHLDIDRYEETIELKNAFKGNFEIGVISETEKIPLDYSFSGILSFKFYKDSKLIYEHQITKSEASLFSSKNNNEFYKALIFMFFDLPIGGYQDGITLHVKVIKGDKRIRDIGIHYLYFASRSIP